MATGHSRNKRGRGNPRARHGPASQPRPANSAGRGTPSATAPTSGATTPPPAIRPADEAATKPTEAASPTANSSRPPAPSEGRESFTGRGPLSSRQGKRPGARPPRAPGRNDAHRGPRRSTESTLAVQANGANGAIHGVSGEYDEHGGQNPAASLSSAELPSPHAERAEVEHTEEASATERAPADLTSVDVISAEPPPFHAAEPVPRPINREHGWRALPPRGARPRDEPSATFAGPPNHQASVSPAAPPATRAPRGPEAEEPEEPATPVWHPERPPHRSPNGAPNGAPSAIVAPNGHAPFRPEVRGALGPLIDSLHDLFAHDRTIASQGSNARCGICYLHHPLSELDYHEAEGFYVCSSCQQALGHHTINMVRRQQR